MKFDSYDITYKEIPDEVSLSISVSGCPFECSGCHSPHLRKDIGTDIWSVIELIEKYSEHITVVCFLGHGGLYDTIEFEKLLGLLSGLFPGLEFALYSGFDHMFEGFKPYLKYYKIGRYIKELGGLESETTNQKLHIL